MVNIDPFERDPNEPQAVGHLGPPGAEFEIIPPEPSPEPKSMGRSELAILILQWESQQQKADALAETIKAHVLSLAETVTVGNIKAKYSKGRKSYDYETPCKASDRFENEVPGFTEEIPEVITPATIKIDFRALAKHLGVDPLVVKPGTPSVKLEVLK